MNQNWLRVTRFASLGADSVELLLRFLDFPRLVENESVFGE
jgi:hypothetical protein